MAQAGSSTAGPPPAKRIKKFEVISGAADAATRAANALDLESDDVPDQFKCPICKEVPLGNVIQCMNGHPICLECQLKSGKLEECSQCRASMKNTVGNWIRNRMVEEILDGLWFTCPFRQNGCKKTLSRGQVRSHQENCRFEERVQICKYFEDGNSCDYWTRTAKFKDALCHLMSNHLDYYVLDHGRGFFWFNVGMPIPFDFVEAVVTKQNGATFLTIAWSDKQADNISFACVRMDKPTPREVAATKVELTLERQTPAPCLKIPNWKLTLPIVSVLDAPKTVLDQKPGVIPRPFLKQYLQQVNKKTRRGGGDEESESDVDGETASDDEEDLEVAVKVLVAIS